MPTELETGKTNQQIPDSIVDVSSKSNPNALQISVQNKIITSSNTLIKTNSNTSSTTKNTKKKINFFGFIKDVLSSDLLWISVAMSCLFATVLFYFQILQPQILQKYSETAQAQIIEGTQRIYLQADQVASIQQRVISNTENLSSDSCTEEAKYDQSNKDRKDIENLKTSLKLDPKIKELPSFGVFYDKQIKTIYNFFIAEYENTLNEFQPAIANTKHIVEFVDYKDNWIDQCIAIKNSTGETKELQIICKNINIKAENYQKIAPAGIMSELAEPIRNINTLCVDVNASSYENYPQFNSFKLKWLKEYDNIKGLAIVIDSTSVASIKNNFEMTIKKIKNELEETVQNRQEFLNIWYLLGFNIR